MPWVRIAAWQALADLNDVESLPALVEAAMKGEAPERDVARESLTRLRGDAVAPALAAQLEKAGAKDKAILLQVLGERAGPGTVEVLLRHASGAEPVRTAALGIPGPPGVVGRASRSSGPGVPDRSRPGHRTAARGVVRRVRGRHRPGRSGPPGGGGDGPLRAGGASPDPALAGPAWHCPGAVRGARRGGRCRP